MKVIAQLIGIYVETDYYIPVILDDLDSKDYTISPRLMANVTNILANIIQNENESTLEEHLENVVNLICKLENDFSDQPRTANCYFWSQLQSCRLRKKAS